MQPFYAKFVDNGKKSRILKGYPDLTSLYQKELFKHLDQNLNCRNLRSVLKISYSGL